MEGYGNSWYLWIVAQVYEFVHYVTIGNGWILWMIEQLVIYGNCVIVHIWYNMVVCEKINNVWDCEILY